MSQIRLLVLFPLLGILAASPAIAQTSAHPEKSASDNADYPILDAPYSAKRHFISYTKKADGTLTRDESGGSEARDSQGRTFSAGERHWTYLEGNKSILGSEMLYRIDDPVANTKTKWDSTSKEAKIIHWPQSDLKRDALETACPCNEQANTSNTGVEKLGTRNIQGLVVEGTRSSYTVAIGRNQNDKPYIVVHEIWYSPKLKIVVLETNDDPSSGSTRNELIDINLGEPDTKQYRPPSDYVIHDLQMPP
ncbi:hypothetical protein [Tunturibacter empetritectus]|uniref:Outer membrane lipoprotein-sorting protein n=1 Tax=Tunturiibacter lichenicola TaxID=2051959 RepID=A0A7W8J707_9BACT|nr:hypothetical protein [Edaphobacter lichenicola]MBB5342756.1 hypothetical protein [Edaphobacter lichenicola]